MKAFPNQRFLNTSTNGMDLRDYFAAHAMQGYLSCKGWHPDFEQSFEQPYAESGKTSDVLSRVCYKMADAMIKQREETK